MSTDSEDPLRDDGLDPDDEISSAGMETRTRQLIESRMPQRSWAQLERETGLDNLVRRLNQAHRQGYVPLDVLAAVHKATGITVAELVVAFFADAGYGDLLPYTVDPDNVKMVRRILLADPVELALVTSWLDWMDWIRDSSAPA